MRPAFPLHVKAPNEVRDTLRRSFRAERGFLSNRVLVALTAATGFGIARRPLMALAPIAVLLADFGVFAARRWRVLRAAERGGPRLQTPTDYELASRAFTDAGVPEPTMTDYETAAGLSDRPWGNDLRYAYLVAQYERGTVADIGCGDGRLCWRYAICPAENYFGVDPGRELVRTLIDKTGGRAHGVVAVADATTLPDNSMDLVVCSECFEHLPDPRAALREFARIARPGGKIVIQSPSAYRVRNLNPFHVITTFAGRIVPDLLQRTVVHENTFIRAYTYHWDFTRHDFAQYCAGLPVAVREFRTATYRFNPRGNVFHRLGFRIARWPVINGIWWDMTVVLQKRGASGEESTDRGRRGAAGGDMANTASGAGVDGMSTMGTG
jgi:SAM-dependent methyltransferase